MAHLRVTRAFMFSVFSFSIFLFSFKNIALPASVSEFNCFLRGRCSMEMWCPDDTQRGIAAIGSDNLLGREHDSTPQGGGSSPVETDPLQIGSLLLLTQTYRNRVYVNSVLANCAREPPMAKNSSPSRAPKNGRSTPRRSAKNPSQPPNPTALSQRAEKLSRLSKCELRRHLRVHHQEEKLKFFQKLRKLTHAVTARYRS